MITENPSPRLEMHVLSAGIGESIVVRLPDGKWGVVDCYSPSLADPSRNPTVGFLKAHGAAALEFLCLTHPHADHFRGMSQLLRAFPVRYFWRSGACTPEQLRDLILVVQGNAALAGGGSDIESANEFAETLRMVKTLRQRKQLAVKHLSDVKQLHPAPADNGADRDPGRAYISCVAPSSNRVDAYHETLRSCFDSTGKLKADPPRLRHNDVSAALLIEFGQTRIVLGGDVELPGWDETIGWCGRDGLAADGVKVPHHGSDDANSPNLWSVFAGRRKPVAAIAPYFRQLLPSPACIGVLRDHTSRAFVTCRGANAERWDFGAPRPLSSQLCLRRRFKSFRVISEKRLGVCSLEFDNLGHCVSTQTDGAAAELWERQDPYPGTSRPQ